VSAAEKGGTEERERVCRRDKVCQQLRKGNRGKRESL